MSNGRVEEYYEDKIYYGANSSVKMNPRDRSLMSMRVAPSGVFLYSLFIPPYCVKWWVG